MELSRIKKLIFLHIQHLPMKSRCWRPMICKLGGVTIIDYKNTFIGEDVLFDTNYPQDIIIEKGVRLTAGVKIVTHFMNPTTGRYDRGKVYICKSAYLGMCTWWSNRLRLVKMPSLVQALSLLKIYLPMRYGREIQLVLLERDDKCQT